MFKRKEEISKEVKPTFQKIINPYNGSVSCCNDSVLAEVSLERLIDIRTGKYTHLVRQEVNYFRWLAGLDVFIVEQERVDIATVSLWVYDQAGRLLRHLGYDRL